MGKHKSSKSHKKDKKRKKQDSTSSDEWVEAPPVHKDKKKKKHKKKHHKSSESSSEECNVKHPEDRRKSSDNMEIDDDKHITSTKESLERDDWMNLSTSFSSFSNIDRRKQREQEKKIQKESEQYDPRKCSRELNPYWKNKGDGLPKFKKPQESDSDNEKGYKAPIAKTKSNWRKQNTEDVAETKTQKIQDDQTLSNEDLNVLAGKIVKAEIMGKTKLALELKEKLEKSRKAVAESKSADNMILLTQTDSQGRSKPISLLNDGASGSGLNKQRKKAVETHQNKERVRYFPDDDKYSLKDMYENEKYNNTTDQDSEFMNIASNIRKNDDFDDFFTDNVRRKKSDAKVNESNKSKAISDHKKISDSLDNCPYCIQSANMAKNLIIFMGEYAYLSLPEYEALTEGHCLISPIRHSLSVTDLDENEYSEILDIRRSLVKLFQSKGEDVVFSEIAVGFYKHPHMVIQCVPLPKEEGDMAPIYFKKAIDESETEWSQNKKLVSLKGRDVRRAIPKGLPYFSVSFGMEEGYAHVIEDEQMFPKNFAQEIIGGMLDLHHSKWRKPKKQSFAEQSKRVVEFSKEWKSFDYTIK